LCAVLRQGFELCQARDRQPETNTGAFERPLEPLLPGFVCASAAMQRVAEQIQRMRGNDLTVLITGESGTGKDLVARAIHAGSPRHGNMFLPITARVPRANWPTASCLATGGSFAGAIADRLVCFGRPLAGRCSWTKLAACRWTFCEALRFLEQGEVLPVGARPQRSMSAWSRRRTPISSRVSEADSARTCSTWLSVIAFTRRCRRREEIPHLSTFACGRRQTLGNPGVRLTAETLDIFDAFPGPQRQLRGRQRAVAVGAADGSITPNCSLRCLECRARRWRMASDREAGERRSPPRSKRSNAK
jgi:hypothetical protein